MSWKRFRPMLIELGIRVLGFLVLALFIGAVTGVG